MRETSNLKERMRLFESSPYGTPEESRRVEEAEIQRLKQEKFEEERRNKAYEEGFDEDWKRESERYEEQEAFRTPGEEERRKRKAEKAQPDQSLMMRGMLKLMDGHARLLNGDPERSRSSVMLRW